MAMQVRVLTRSAVYRTAAELLEVRLAELLKRFLFCHEPRLVGERRHVLGSGLNLGIIFSWLIHCISEQSPRPPLAAAPPPLHAFADGQRRQGLPNVTIS